MIFQIVKCYNVYLNAACLLTCSMVSMGVRVNIESQFKDRSAREQMETMETRKPHQLSNSKTSVSHCCFLCFQVSLVTKITQIIHTNLPDICLTCNWYTSVEYLLYRNGFVSSKKSVSISVFRRANFSSYTFTLQL